jgi:hypothetical protein
MRTRPFLVAALVLGWSLLAPVALAGQKSCLGGLLPDLRTVVPKHLEIQNEHQREILRFTNGIANTGAGDWRMRPDPPPGTGLLTNAVQEILDENGEVVCSKVVSTFEFHPEHNHWHIGDVALFEVRKARDDGTGGIWAKVFVNDRGEAQSIKTTFCLIDWYKLDDNTPASERVFFDCYHSFQGIQAGWVDQYHQSTEGQQLDLTGVPNADDYYLVSTANYAQRFLESDYTNNTAWVKFRLYADSNGNRKVKVTDHSPCESPGMCGERSTNR